jgi:uncharacterized protein (TIGR01777 family)
MRIGITGVTGFIGSALARAAVSRGHGIVAYSRRTDLFLPWAKEIRRFDAASPHVLDASGLDVLVHLAGESVMGYWTSAKMARIRDSRVDVTRRIVEGMKECSRPPSALICSSATGAYGDRGDEILTETSPRGNGFLADVCAEWEAAASRALSLNMRVALLRTGVVLGKEGGAWPKLERIFSLRLGSRLGSGRQWVPWIHIDDEVRIILHAIEDDTFRGPLNLAAPQPVTNREMTDTIAELLGKSRFLPAPGFALRLLLGRMSSIFLGSQRVQPKAVLDRGFEFKYTELPHALAALL